MIDSIINVLSEINTVKKKISIILISNNIFYNLNLNTFKNLDISFIKRPFSLSSLKGYIDEKIKNKSTYADSGNISIVNFEKTEKTKYIYDAIIKVVKNNLNVLISGESGTGKNYIAKTINDLITKKKILEITHLDYQNNYLSSLLLGKTSLKGYLKNKGLEPNRLSDCILFSDIDAMPLNTQVLVFHELRKKNNNINTLFKGKKIIATTTKNIKNSLRNNNFSNELFYELDMYNIFTLPLRERVEDIQNLAVNFIIEYNKKNKKKKEISSEGLLKISSYLWPGNIKQLKNFVYRILMLSNKNVIDNKTILKEIANEFSYDEKNYIDNWKTNFRNFISNNIRGYLNNTKKIDTGFYYKVIKDFEKPLLIEILKYTNYNQLSSAEILGINRNTLRKKMFDYNIQVTKKTLS